MCVHAYACVGVTVCGVVPESCMCPCIRACTLCACTQVAVRVVWSESGWAVVGLVSLVGHGSGREAFPERRRGRQT